LCGRIQPATWFSPTDVEPSVPLGPPSVSRPVVRGPPVNVSLTKLARAYLYPLGFPDRNTMNYRRLGNSGLKLSELSFGSWVTYGAQLGDDSARECMAAAHDAGVNFFDNAEVYARGASETIMGNVLRKMGWPRSSYIVSTKFFWGLHDGPNEKSTLNRKYLMQAIDGSLKRLQLDHVDLVFCHRADPETPIEETVWAMHDIIRSGRAHYWGTSEWSAGEIMAAWQIA